MGKLKKAGKVLLILLGLAVLTMAVALAASEPGRREVKNLVIGTIDFHILKDGTYAGEYVGEKDHSRDVLLQVTIASGKITEIKLIKGAVDKEGVPLILTQGLSVKNLFESAVKAQSLQVDAISGATLTSKTHLKALENALLKAPEK